MADLPALSESTKRILELRSKGLLDTHRLGGNAIIHYARASDMTRRNALGPLLESGSRYFKNWFQNYLGARRECGISSSVEFTKARFSDFASEYLRLWSPSTGYEHFAAQLEVLKQQVLGEVASIWKKSDATEQWFKTVVAPAVNTAISQKLGEFEDRARNSEMAFLAQPQGSAEKSDGSNPPLAAPLEQVDKEPDHLPKKRGPKRDYETASKVAEIVKQIAPDGKWRPQLDEICQELDEQKIPMPKPWKPNHGYLTWCEAGLDTNVRGRHMAIEAIKHHLELAKEMPTETIP